jgi:hypothetical protein
MKFIKKWTFAKAKFFIYNSLEEKIYINGVGVLKMFVPLPQIYNKHNN